ncbi:MAG TPA: dTMP kinase [Longimicrobium sp.]|nr:dTMP kinase [Longimicrobium sp.]
MADTLHPPAAGPDRRGRFIVLEGIDGAGTTTQLNVLRDHYRRAGRKAFFTHEPSDGPVGMLIRLALQKRLVGANFDLHDPGDPHPGAADFDAQALALLFAADRADHVATQVLPNLQAGRDVICDRYLLSTLAYQGQHADLEWLIEINRPAIVPDLTVFLDVPPGEAEERMRSSRWKKEIFETPEQQRRIRARYFDLIGREFPQKGPVEVLDASRPAAQVSEDLLALLGGFLTGEPR